MDRKIGSAAFSVGIGAILVANAQASKLAEAKIVDENHILIRFQDGMVKYNDDGKGPGAMQGHESGRDDKVIRFNPPLDLVRAMEAGSFRISSKQDPTYASGIAPAKVFRKSKVNGTPNQWPEPEFTMDHTVYLRLAKPLKPNVTYTIALNGSLGSDAPTISVRLDAKASESEAIHVNLAGYAPGRPATADLYMWLGDGGSRDYKPYEGRTVWVLDTKTGKRTAAGKVAFGRTNAKEYGNWDLTKTPIWHCDFKTPTTPSTYRLWVDGIGLSGPFEVTPRPYEKAFAESLVGFYYMRIGESPTMSPPPRQPRFIPNVDPPEYVVYRTTFGPFHPDWTKSGRDTWDVTDWSKYMEPGKGTNPNAWGGHSDACDWDRHGGHVSIIYDLLLPYILSGGALSSDKTGIRESGNKIPDVIDEAQFEVDFWLRLRDGNGDYSFGMNNPDGSHKVMYQAGARPYMAWVNAANCAMLADAYRLAKNESLMRKYRDAALEAWNRAKGQDLDYKYSIGNGVTRGRDHKMMAAAFLYSVTGEKRFEDALAEESVVREGVKTLDDSNAYCQLWGTASYLMTAKTKLRPIRHPMLLENMKLAVARDAETKHLAGYRNWPSRRSSDTAYGWFQSIITITPLAIAHAADINPDKKSEYVAAMLAEADWSLGRNPLNRILMTGNTPRHVNDIYTSGRDDGVPGVHPGHTPYMNSEPWGEGYMADPRWYAKKGYPDWSLWPQGEALWAARYCYSNNEFTPQQAMRGKSLLYGYLATLKW